MPSAQATAALVAAQPGTVALVGDIAYDQSTPSQLSDCYGPTWGQFKSRSKPAPGNHEYGTGRADAYLAYFGVTRWYSYDLGAWHVIALDANCSLIGGCGAGSPEERWLRADLAAHHGACTLAYWHQPRWSSGLHGSTTTVEGLWRALADAKADVVVSAHDHDYERFGLIDGMREFVAGTGGRSHYPFGPAIAGSEVRNGSTFGVLVMTLHPLGYDWRFEPVAGSTFTDAGSDVCR